MIIGLFDFREKNMGVLTFGLILFLHLIANSLAIPFLAVPLLCIILSILLGNLATLRSWFEAVFLLFFGAIAFAFLSQLLGELMGGWATSRFMMSIYLCIISFLICKQTHAFQNRKLLTLTSTGIATSLASLCTVVLQLKPESLINFLGFGYDNSGHFMQGRMILQSGGSLLLSGHSDLAPSFLQDASQMTGSMIASLSDLTGVRPSNTSGLLAVLVIITLALPCLALLSPVLGFITKPHKFSETVVVSVASTVMITTGYLSRIWFSGYMGSNLGTVCAILIVVYLVTQKTEDITIPLIAMILMVHTYPVFLLVGVLLVVPKSMGSLFPLRSLPSRMNHLAPRYQLIVLLAATALLLLPISATKRSYGGSQFLVDGGIEPLPTQFFLFLLVLFVIPIGVIHFRSRRKELLPLLHGCLLGITLVAVYSIEKVNRLTYYPTKVIIVFVMLLASIVISSLSSINLYPARQFIFCILAYLAAVNLFFQPQEKVFTTAYMGKANTVLQSAFKGESVVVNANAVKRVSMYAKSKRKPVLFLSNLNESELNTRWINTLSLQWNDATWSGWLNLREQIEKQNFSSLSDSLANMIIVTDNEVLYQALHSFSEKNVCILAKIEKCDTK